MCKDWRITDFLEKHSLINQKGKWLPGKPRKTWLFLTNRNRWYQLHVEGREEDVCMCAMCFIQASINGFSSYFRNSYQLQIVYCAFLLQKIFKNKQTCLFYFCSNFETVLRSYSRANIHNWYLSLFVRKQYSIKGNKKLISKGRLKRRITELFTKWPQDAARVFVDSRKDESAQNHSPGTTQTKYYKLV